MRRQDIAQRCRLAATGHRLGRRVLTDVVTLVTSDTILRWHRQLIARKWTADRRRVGRPGVLREIRQLTVRMARENPTWSYRRIQGALKNLEHRVARSTIAGILRAHGIGPVPERPMSWGTFLAAHWGAIAAADFFTTEVWTVRGLVTYYTLFVIELESRRVHLLGSTPSPADAFVVQVTRTLTDPDGGILLGRRILICDRDTKWSAAFRQTLADAGIRAVQTPYHAPNCNPYAERLIGSIRRECLDHVIVLGERHSSPGRLSRLLSWLPDTSVAREGLAHSTARAGPNGRRRDRVPASRRIAPSLRAARSLTSLCRLRDTCLRVQAMVGTHTYRPLAPASALVTSSGFRRSPRRPRAVR